MKNHDIQFISENIEFRMMKAEVTNDDRVINLVDPDLSGDKEIIVVPLVGTKQKLIIEGDVPEYIVNVLEKKQFPTKVSLFLNRDSFDDYTKQSFTYDWIPY